MINIVYEKSFRLNLYALKGGLLPGGCLNFTVLMWVYENELYHRNSG